MIRNSEVFYAKILLFGEYSVIHGSMALSAPYGHFRGELSFLQDDRYTDYDFAVKSNLQMKEYLMALMGNRKKIAQLIDLKRLEKDILNGLYFESTIPQGYGLGSSGALTAAVFSKYGLNPDWRKKRLSQINMFELKRNLSLLEGFFHGTSSGFDPLSSYLKFPILVEGPEKFSTIGIPRNKDYGNAGIFLVNTGIPRKTGELVDHFMQRCREDVPYYNRLIEEYIPLNNHCINAILKGSLKEFMRDLALISMFQFQQFEPMIPEGMRSLWMQGLQKKDYYLKLCGAGGGGFLLGFARDISLVLGLMADNQIETVTVYRSEPKSNQLIP